MDASRFPNELALMMLGSRCSYDIIYGLKLYNQYSRSSHNVSETASDDEGIHTIVPDRSSTLDLSNPDAMPIIAYETPEDPAGKLIHSQWQTSRGKRHFNLDKGQSLSNGLGIKHDSFSRTLSEKDVKRWTQATIAMRQEPEKYSADKELRSPPNCLRKRSKNIVNGAINVTNLRDGFIDDFNDDPFYYAMLIVLPIVYGSVHLAAWNFEFPTKVEMIMWRVACTFIASGFLGAIFIVLIIRFSLVPL